MATDWQAIVREVREATIRRIEAEKYKRPQRSPRRPVWNPAAEILPERKG